MLKTVTVTVLRPGEAARDRFGNDVPGEAVSERVAGVLVVPGATADLEASRPDGVTVAYTLHFPKTYAAPLGGCTVVLPDPWDNGGKGYRVVGDPRPYMDGNTPGRWDRPVEVEVADG